MCNLAFPLLTLATVSSVSALFIPREAIANSTCSPPSVLVQMASCLNFPAIPAILATPSVNTYLDPMETWLSGFCAPTTPICSDEVLEAMVKDVTNHCFDFIPSTNNARVAANTGSPGSVFPFPFSLLDPAPARRPTEETIGLVQRFYPTLRKVMCTRDKGELCLTKTTLRRLEAHVGRLSEDNLVSVPSFLPAPGADLSGWTDFFCTDCMKATFIIAQENPELLAEAKVDDVLVQGVCGATFLDGVLPSTIALVQ